MRGGRITRWAWILAVIACGTLTTCRKPDDAAKSDLGEAGYPFTTEGWFAANRADDVPAVKKFLVGGFPVGTKNASGDSALHAAAGTGSLNACKLLLDSGLDINSRGAGGRTPLMTAVIEDQTAATAWLLRQGADPALKDDKGYLPLLLAVREGKSGPAAELSPSSRQSLDSAILLAALLGRTEIIDTLTNYGASVYARMEDGRTPLMIAAENGHQETVKLLLEIGSSRFSTDANGRTAAELAAAAGHNEVTALLNRSPLPDALVFEEPAEVARAMDDYVEQATAGDISAASPQGSQGPTPSSPARQPAQPISGQTLSTAKSEPSTQNARASFPMPPLAVRHYREQELPVRVDSVAGEIATFTMGGGSGKTVRLRAGERLPDSNLIVRRIQRRLVESKLNQGVPTEMAVVEIADPTTGRTREWLSGLPATAHDPVALVEDIATGRRYSVSPGERFKSADGMEFIISDVRPNQVVVENTSTGAVRTLPLRGPRG